MASKRAPKAAPANDDLDDLFEGIGDEKAAPKKGTKPKTGVPAAAKGKAEPDILAELENELGEKQPSRPHTPRIKEPAKRATGTPPPAGERLSTEDRPAAQARKSGDSTRSYHASFTPSATSSDLHEAEKKGPVEQTQAAAASGGGWWGGFLNTATAAMKQAEAAVKEIQSNEEAKKWADQVRGNVTALRGYGDELRHRALPTFTNILHTLAPPISSHERLLIHITHDMVGYPSLDPLIYGVFSRVMAQVEGGDLLVIQRGQENTLRSPTADKHSFFTGAHSAAGWRDGPWWRASDLPRDLGSVKGLTEGTKLCRASAEAYANDFFAAQGGLELARQRAIEPVSESNPVRSSDLFLGVQAITTEGDRALFAGTAAGEKEKADSAVLSEDDTDELVCFAVYVLDPVHEIVFHAISQAIPAKWMRWLDAPAPLTPASSAEDSEQVPPGGGGDRDLDLERVPEEIREIVESGGVDPREWVAEWLEEVLTLSVGVVAQRYVARRMGVGEGGIGKGKRRMEELVQEGGGEAARAGLI
ncbi:uncharacterized protein E0L32_009900 [Thyridium curvatum]|uniref:Maintenance of telomere capping protein 1 n=1 Tax=Thyridium curvatum TaxID=1093900 RepID=A0A507AUH6_9PEZI|nr:uncharacterized protein E0L32_009900 [Thyridium curvatum]TPX08561.1 hypothetical protein E0L32_009900 [Thyridium curvatum]